MTVVWTLVAGAAGAWARYEVGGWVQGRSGASWPWGTTAVNLVGAVALGLLVVADTSGWITSDVVTVLGTGFLGAFTTFSTWMVESVHLAKEAGRRGLVAGTVNVVAPLAAGVTAASALLA